MDIFKISLVNLPKQLNSSLTSLIKQEQLGACKTITDSKSDYILDSEAQKTDFIVMYDESISEEKLLNFKAPFETPIVLITKRFSFEMERTAKSCNINLIIENTNPELVALIYGFISQYHIYQSQHALIVDDSRVDSIVVSSNLNKEFIKNDTELNPLKVIATLKAVESINIVIVDYEMPEKNGCQLMQEIKDTFPERDFIFIGITGNRKGAIKFLYHGVDDVFIKPVDFEFFSVTLRKLIFNYHKIQQEKASLADYKTMIKGITKDITDPVYTLSTMNDYLLENAQKSAEIDNIRELCQTSKDKLSTTFDDLLSYLEVSKYLHSSLLKNCSLHSMIAGQLYIESSRAKLKNIIINKSLNVDENTLCVPNQIEQVITHLTQNVITHSESNSQVFVRLYSNNFNVVFEIEDTNKNLGTTEIDSINSTTLDTSDIESISQERHLNFVLCKKVVDSHGGTMGMKRGENGIVYYFKLPSYSISSPSSH